MSEVRSASTISVLRHGERLGRKVITRPDTFPLFLLEEIMSFFHILRLARWKPSLLIVIIGLCVFVTIGYAIIREQARRNLTIRLLESLNGEAPDGASFGGPYVGVEHTEATRRIVQQGRSVVPILVNRLGTSGLNETIYIVFCLRELKACDAKTAVQILQQQIQKKERFRNVRRDLTLEMQVIFFLKEVDTWPGKRDVQN
jgi:hypothetical protein